MKSGEHTVELDRDAELATLQALAGETAAVEQEAVQAAEADAIAAAGHDPAAWLKATEFMVEVLAGQVCPGWGLEAGDKTTLSTALADVLDHYWPGGPNGVDNWHPLYRLGFAVTVVTATRGIDWSTGRLKPLRPQPEKQLHGESEASRRVAPVPGGDDAVGEKRGSFSIGGG